jgi:hypothetical protein
VTTRYERMKMQRRMQRRIRLVVEERRMSLAAQQAAAEPPFDAETTVEIPPPSGLRPAPAPTPAPLRAIGRVTIPSA